MLLIIDNYDSFTFNIAQYFAILKQAVLVKKNDDITIDDIHQLKPDYIVISPGPCDPNKAGISLDVLKHFSGVTPILGVCLGHQCIGQFFGGSVVRANKIMHGRTSVVHHLNTGVFTNLNNPITVTRYHSLVVAKKDLPTCLELTAWSNDGVHNPSSNLPKNWQTDDDIEIMGFKHKELAIEGVQFHPESILSEQGLDIFQNFLNRYASHIK